MNRKRSLTGLLFLLIVSIYPVCAQEDSPFRVVCWNVENLFDTCHDSLKNDHEFLPDGMRRWNYPRYRKKLDNIARALTAVGEWTPPALVGLCEVENDRVLRDLTRYSALREQDYRYVTTDSPDERGIDVALLYQRDRFKLLSHRSIRANKLNPQSRPTRDILLVSGIIRTGDTLDIAVVHLPSRSGGAQKSEPYRLSVARQVRRLADSLLQVRQSPKLIIMGDFNDYPENKSIRKALEATAPTEPVLSRKLYHLLANKPEIKRRTFGSYKYKGEWGLLDHLIVSGTLLDRSSSICTDEEKADVARLPFLLAEDTRYGGKQPFRTYNGIKYQGGYSDHLPVFVDFTIVLPP